MRIFMNEAAKNRADWVPTRVTYEHDVIIRITPHNPPAPVFPESEGWKRLQSHNGQSAEILCGVPETEVYGFSYTTPWPEGRAMRSSNHLRLPIPTGFKITKNLQTTNLCTTLRASPLYTASPTPPEPTRDPENNISSQPQPQLVAKIWDPKLIPNEETVSINPLLWCQNAYCTEVYAYRRLQGKFQEIPAYYGSFTAVIDDDDGQRIVGIVLMTFVDGVRMSALPSVPENLFVQLIVLDLKLLKLKLGYCDYRPENVLVVRRGDDQKLVMVDFADSRDFPFPFPDEDFIIRRWKYNLNNCEMAYPLNDKGLVMVGDSGWVDDKWIRGLVEKAMEQLQVLDNRRRKRKEKP